MFSLQKESISTPIKGRNAVFIVKIINKEAYRSSGDFTEQKNQLTKNTKSYAANSAFSALKELASVVDNRNEFY